MVQTGQARLLRRWSKRELVFSLAGAAFAPRALAAGHEEGSGPSPSAALKRLMDGNVRYAAGRSEHPDLGAARRGALVDGQHPFATVLACSDSRVAPELIFDQGLGDIFVIRDAGNVVDDVVLGSIEYSVIHLGVPLILVLGHEHCGAVTAAVDALAGKTNAEDRDTKIGPLAGLITPAAQAVPANASDKVDAAVLLNARRSANLVLTTSKAVGERAMAGRLQVVSARYGLGDGRVTEVLAAKA
jgi:carbonic anhydrase